MVLEEGIRSLRSEESSNKKDLEETGKLRAVSAEEHAEVQWTIVEESLSENADESFPQDESSSGHSNYWY